MAHVFKYLRSASSEANAAVDGSVTEVPFYWQCPTGWHADIERMVVHIRDGANWDADDYGANALSLAGGILCRIWNATDGVVLDLLDGEPIKANADWGRVCYDIRLDDFGQGSDFMQVRWTFAKSGSPVHLNGDAGDRLEIIIRDDCTFLTAHYFMIQGQSIQTTR